MPAVVEHPSTVPSSAMQVLPPTQPRGRAPTKKRLGGHTSPSHRRADSRGPERRRGRPSVPTQRHTRSKDSDTEIDSDASDGASTSSDDSASTIGQRHVRKDSIRRSLGVGQDLETFAFDSDEEGEETRYIQQQDDWLRAKGKNVRDVRLVLDKSKKDGMIARQILSEIGLDFQPRVTMNGQDPFFQNFDDPTGVDSAPEHNRDLAFRSATSPCNGSEPVCASFLPENTASSTAPSSSRSKSPCIERATSPLRFVRKPSLTAASQSISKSRHSTSPVHHSARPELSSLRRQSASGTEDSSLRRPKSVKMTSNGSAPGLSRRLSEHRHEQQKQPHGRGSHRSMSNRNSSIASVDSLPWLRNLQSGASAAPDEDREPDASFISLPQEASMASSSAAKAKKDRRLSGTLTSVCKAHATGVCERSSCDRHGSQAQILSLASGSLRQSLGQGRARSQSETHLVIEAALRG